MNVFTIAKDKRFDLPLRWDGEDFVGSLNKLFNDYILTMDNRHYGDIERICSGITQSIRDYLSGFPSKAYSTFKKVFKDLMDNHRAYTYIKDNINDRLPDLFRVRKVNDILEYNRKDLFHVPFNKCRYVSTTRYSIAGFPSLYLATSFDLCVEETNTNIDNHLIGGLFRQDDEFKEFVPQIVELGVKPNDFLWEENEDKISLRFSGRWKHINKELLNNPIYQDSYLYWYPLVAACSFIRVNRNDFFCSRVYNSSIINAGY